MSKPTFRYMDQKEVCAIFKLSRSTVERLVADGRLPVPYQLGKRAVRWRSDEIEACINDLPRLDGAYFWWLLLCRMAFISHLRSRSSCSVGNCMKKTICIGRLIFS